MASDGTGNGFYTSWKSATGTSTSDRTETAGSITTHTVSSSDSNFDYSDDNIYTLSKGQRKGSGTIDLHMHWHTKWTEDKTGSAPMGSTTCKIAEYRQAQRRFRNLFHPVRQEAAIDDIQRRVDDYWSRLRDSEVAEPELLTNHPF